MSSEERSIGKPKKFSPAWWHNKDVTIPWSERFCQPFFNEDPTLVSDPKTHASVGIVFSNQRNGDIVPVGMTALQNGNFIFQYHPSYLANPAYPDIAYTLPKQKQRFVAHGAMLPFFDNLPAEGWFGKAQEAALNDDPFRRRPFDPKDGHMDEEALEDRYHRFMMFGRDYPGAVWTTYRRVDPEIAEQRHQATIEAALRSRSSISGMQPKLLGVETPEGELRPANYWETSTHIVKLPPTPGAQMPRLMEYEYMSIVATKALRPDDSVVDAKLTDLKLSDGATEPALAVRRFDRTPEGFKRHFEEVNQLRGRLNADRYKGSYAEIAAMVDEKVGHEGVKQFYGRMLCQFMLGNTDNHMKNFALLHERRGDKWELSPDYDLAPTVNYQKSKLALHATPHRNGEVHESEGNEDYRNLSPKLLVRMGQDFGLSLSEVRGIAHALLGNIDAAKQAVMSDPNPRLDQKVPENLKHASSSRNTSIREDFCARIDGRAKQLFGTLDKYIDLQEERMSSGRGR